MTSTERANWTIAYRKRTANRFLRVSNWSGTWSQAVGMCALYSAAHPELEVWYISDRSAEVEGFVPEEDVRNLLVESGRRVRIVEGGEVPAVMIARIPVAAVARERWIDGDPIAEPEGVTPAAEEPAPLAEVAAEQGFEVCEGTGVIRSFELRDATTGRRVNVFRKAADVREWLAHTEAQRLLATIRIDGRPQVVTEMLERAELLTDCAEHLALVRHIVELDRGLRVAAAAEALLAS